MNSLLEISGLRLGFEKSGSKDILLSECEQLNLYSGNLVCLMGANGSGKSTLISALSGEPILSGSIKLLGKEVKTYANDELAKLCAFVYTDKIDVDYLKVSDLVELGRFPHQRWKSAITNEDKIMIEQAIDAMELKPFLNRNLVTLSDGEKQRAMIARAIAQDPQILLLDEPTSFLDLPHKVKTLKLLRNWSRTNNRAVLLSTHDLSLAMSIADHIWLMTPHKKIVFGAPEDLMLSNAIKETFCTDDIRINPIDGHFEIVQEVCLNIKLEGIDCNWTKRALSRIGYGVCKAGEKSEISLKITNSKLRYELALNNSNTKYSTLFELTSFLRNISKN